MKITYPNGSFKAVTLRFDDASVGDRRMVKLLNDYNLRATFYPIPKCLDEEGFVTANELPLLYKGHEIGNHTYSHIDPRCNDIDEIQLKEELEKGKKTLEKLFGEEVKGYAYVCSSFGNVGKRAYMRILEETGHSYAIMGRENHSFVPDVKDRFDVGQSFRFSDPELLIKTKEYADYKAEELSVMLVMAHTVEFNNTSLPYGWSTVEDFLKIISNKNDIWYATNGEIIEYLVAAEEFEKCNKNRDILENSTKKTIYGIINGKSMVIESGASVNIKNMDFAD